MGTINIEVKQEDVKDAFLQTAIQHELGPVLTKLLNDAWQSYETTTKIRATIAEFLAQEVKTIIEAKYLPLIKTRVDELLKEETVATILNQIANKFTERLTERY